MLSLIVLLIFGLAVAFFAVHNTGSVQINLGSNYLVYSLPVYLLAIGSMLIGFFVSWVLSIFGSLSSAFKIHGKDAAINEANKKINQLSDKVRELELENARLQGKTEEKPVVRAEEAKTPSLAERLRQKFNPAY